MKFRKYNKKYGSEVKNIFKQYWTDSEFLSELADKLDSDNCRFYVVEDNGEIVGIVGLRNAPPHFNNYSDTKKPIELYIIASKYKNRGIGSLLGQKVIEKVKRLQFTEMLCYSPETHNSSWKFYENLGFTKYGIINDPEDGYPGMLWKKII